MNRQLQVLFMVMILLVPFIGQAVSLNDIYNAAPALAGYDRVLVLSPDQTYTGGITIWNEKVAIWGNGAVIDLQGYPIIAIGKGLLDIDGCVITNGSAGVSVADEVRTCISNCVFYNNGNGIEHNSTMASLIVYNTVFMNNQNMGLYTSEENLSYLEYNIAYQNAGGDYIAGCGS